MEKIEGIVIRRMDYKETSKIVFLYTSRGKKSFVIHGANKILSPYLSQTEILNLIDVFVQGKGLMIGKEIETLNGYREIKEDLEKYTYLLHLAEILWHVSDADIDHERLYGFFLKVLDRTKATKNYIPYIYMFEVKLLYLLGIQPEFSRCVICHSEKIAAFSVRDGGCVCEKHLPLGETFSKEAALELGKLYRFDIDKGIPDCLDEETAMVIRKLLDSYYLYHLELKTKVRETLAKLLGY